MTDEELIQRAERAGWRWIENLKTGFGSPKFPFTGWITNRKGTSAKHQLNKVDGLEEVFGHGIDCKHCGDPIHLGYLHNEELKSRKECFLCNFWMRLKEGGKGIIVQQGLVRKHYQIGTAKEPGPWNGYAGAWFTIRFLNGEEIRTCDLWHQGIIPERFYDLFPVTAEFITERK